MGSLSITWKLRHHGWAFVEVADEEGEAEVFASYVTDAPEQFLCEITRLMLGNRDTRAEFQGEPQVYRWSFHRDDSDVDIRLVRAKNDREPDSSGVALWSGRHASATLGRSAVRAFDQIAHELGEEGYESQWGRPFPRTELEALRTAVQAHVKGSPISDISG
ncbi:hypothetical protein [Streptomyces sp. NPDC056663]|uniref:hypothetical protein n=1 Tax=unclassified Streptomyces TaxID=2593676 RepID=UPI003635BC70